VEQTWEKRVAAWHVSIIIHNSLNLKDKPDRRDENQLLQTDDNKTTVDRKKLLDYFPN
jgi:hypothetical protein